MCVMSAGDREGEPIISCLCVCVGLSSDTTRLLVDPLVTDACYEDDKMGEIHFKCKNLHDFTIPHILPY